MIAAKLGCNVVPNLNLIAAYTDARTSKSNDPSEIGKRKAQVPYNQVSLWADYQSLFGVSGLKAGGGLRYIDQTVSDMSGAIVPS